MIVKKNNCGGYVGDVFDILAWTCMKQVLVHIIL